MAERRKEKFRKDCEGFFQVGCEQPDYPVTEVFLEEETLRCSVVVGDSIHEFFFIGSEDYPHNTIFSCQTCSGGDINNKDSTVQQAFDVLAEEHGIRMRGKSTSCTQPSPTFAEEEEDFDLDLTEENPLDEVTHIGRVLMKDLEEFQSCFEEGTLHYHHLQGLETVDIYILIPAALLVSRASLEAWKLPEDPLVLKLEDVPITDHCYRRSNPPKSFIQNQDPETKPGAAQKQLEQIVTTYLQKNWCLNSYCDSSNLLVDLRVMIMRRLPRLSDYCMICDEKQLYPMLLPCVCHKNLCVFAFETLGLMADVGTIATQLEVVILLQAMLRQAAFSARALLILDPFPKVPDPKNAQKFLFREEEESKDMEGLRNVLSCLPCPQNLASAPDWTEATKECHELAWKLFSDRGFDQHHRNDVIYGNTPFWITTISSNRTFLVKLKEESRLDFMHTNHQFLMLTDTPAKEQAFREAQKEFGSLFLFHGSPMENWHSILRKGLVNASGTKYQMHGAAFGNGIYFSPQLQMSMGYSHMSMGYGRPKDQRQWGECPSKKGMEEHCCTNEGKYIDWNSSSLYCIAICEVIDSPALNKHHQGYGGMSMVWTLANPEHCCTRFLFVFDCNNMQKSQQDVLITDRERKEKLSEIISQYMPMSNPVVATAEM